jgi:hypothetical protein
MPFKKFIYILLFCSFILPLNSLISQVTEQVQPVTNIGIFENELKKTLVNIENKMVIIGKDKIFDIQINSIEEQKDFFMAGVRKFLSDYKVVFGDTSGADYIVKIDSFNPVIIYKDEKTNITLDKKLNRFLILSFKFEIRNKINNEIADSGLLKESFDDIISYDDVAQAEASMYSFTKGHLPKQSVPEQFLIPGIVLLVSAVAVILFFIIRSK